MGAAWKERMPDSEEREKPLPLFPFSLFSPPSRLLTLNQPPQSLLQQQHSPLSFDGSDADASRNDAVAPSIEPCPPPSPLPSPSSSSSSLNPNRLFSSCRRCVKKMGNRLMIPIRSMGTICCIRSESSSCCGSSEDSYSVEFIRKILDNNSLLGKVSISSANSSMTE